MIVFRYTKKDGAEYIPHLDMLKHLQKVIRRANIPMGYSKGFNPHMHIFMSSPIGVGLKSESEYCCIETSENAKSFIEKFNANTFKGFSCLNAVNVSKKVSVAGIINRAKYVILGINGFDVNEILSLESLTIDNKKGEPKEVRNKIFDMQFKEDALFVTLGFGNDTLRADLFANELLKRYGGEKVEIVKLESYVNDIPMDEYLKGLN